MTLKPLPSWFAVSPYTGTGKTTVARRVGALFASLGLLSDGQVMACSASDFVTGYANQSGGKTREVFESALGRVLFIDEAYRCGLTSAVVCGFSSTGCRSNHALDACVHASIVVGGWATALRYRVVCM